MNNSTKIIIHCSGSRFGNVALVTKWHIDRGFRTIGYHFLILNGQLDARHYNDKFDGWIETGRPLDEDSIIDTSEEGAHVFGYNNKSVGICLIGESGKFSDIQKVSLLSILSDLKNQFTDVSIYQHSDFDKKKYFCAGLTEKEMQAYRILL